MSVGSPWRIRPLVSAWPLGVAGAAALLACWLAAAAAQEAGAPARIDRGPAAAQDGGPIPLVPLLEPPPAVGLEADSPQPEAIRSATPQAQGAVRVRPTPPKPAIFAAPIGPGAVEAVAPVPSGAVSAAGQPLLLAQPQPPRQLVSPAGRQGPITPRVEPRPGEVLVPVNKSQVLNVDRAFDEVLVGNDEVADVVPLTTRSVYIFGKALGTTNLTFLNPEGDVIAVVDLAVTYDIEGLKVRMFELLPDERIEVHAAGDRIVLSGQVESVEQLARALAIAKSFAPDQVTPGELGAEPVVTSFITNLLSVGGSQQVLLSVRFAEVERSTVKQLGLNTNILVQSGDTTFQLDSGDGISIDPPSFAASAVSVITGDIALDVLFDTLEEKGVVKILAEPNLIALSGDTASFLAGGEFPIPVSQETTGGFIEITIEFKQFGVSLAFTPTVLDKDLINLVVRAEVSAIDPTVSVRLANIEVPGLSVRRANTTVELRDGQSFAIAGLLQDDFQDAVRQIPLLGDIPVLGTLFRSTSFQRGQSELVVVITPHLVEPVPAGTLATPADTFVPPSDAELFLFGRIEGEGVPVPTSSPALALGARAAGGIDGPYGYILR